ncbi:MAG: FMN-binding negative transcriptional regulator [Henriciella sp.]
MHPSSLFHTDAEAARAIIAQNPLATIAANGPDGPIVAVVPVVWSEDECRLIGHVARTNAFWTALQDKTPNATAVFRADDAYVSASAYPSKAEHGKVVPTWNYIAAEARGRLTFQTELVDIRASVAALSDQMEADRDAPWAVTDAPETYIDKLAQAIVAFEIEVSALKGVRKLSQNKSESERAGVIADLARQTGSHAAIAEEMRGES